MASSTGENSTLNQSTSQVYFVDSTDPMDVCKAYLQHRGVCGRVVFAMLTGSQAYNLVTPTSDKDYLGIYVVDSRELLEIDGEQKFPNQPLATLPSETNLPDVTLYELKQFVKLLVKGNPFMIETLFTASNYVSTPSFDRLRETRRQVLTRGLVEEFLSYVRGQMVVHQRKGLKGKRAYHIIRLLLELNRIVAGEEPWIAFKEGLERDRLVYIRSVNQPGPEILEAAEGMIKEIEKLRPWNLPDDCERLLDGWLIDERLRGLLEPEKK